MTNRRTPDMTDFGTKWAAALARQEPELDETRSRERWLDAFQASAPSARRSFSHPGWTSRLPWLAAAAVLLLAIGAVVGTAGQGWLRPGPEAGAWLETAPGAPQPLVFGDGSRVEIAGASRVRVARVDPQGARIVVESGAVRASVVHRPDTHWAFESGPFVVRITGTELGIRWLPATQDFAVEVTAGSVWVTGPMLEGGRRVTAGQRCRVRVAESKLEVTPLASNRSDPGEAPSVVVNDLPLEADPSASVKLHAKEPLGPPGHEGASGTERPSFVELERAGRYADALATAERTGLDAILSGGSGAELMSLERAARLGGRAELARRALMACRTRFPGSPDAATAAYLLGRSAGPADAARWFETYLKEHPSGALAREAEGRVVESYQRAGNAVAAKAAATRYLARYPDGPHAAFARGVLGLHDTPE